MILTYDLIEIPSRTPVKVGDSTIRADIVNVLQVARKYLHHPPNIFKNVVASDVNSTKYVCCAILRAAEEIGDADPTHAIFYHELAKFIAGILSDRLCGLVTYGEWLAEFIQLNSQSKVDYMNLEHCPEFFPLIELGRCIWLQDLIEEFSTNDT